MHVVTRVEVEREILVGKLYDGSYADGYLITVNVAVSGDVVDEGDTYRVDLDPDLDLIDEAEETLAWEALYAESERVRKTLPMAVEVAQ